MDDTLRKFIAVVEAGTFTRAADILHISQPALSVAVGKLEKSLGVKLIESSGRHGLSLTEAGNHVYMAALEHRRVEQNLRAQIASLTQAKVPLRIGMIDSVAALLSTHDNLLETLESKTELGLHVLNSAALRKAVRRSELDIAVVVADDEEDDRLEVAAVTADNLVLVCVPDQQASMQKKLLDGDALPFLSYASHSATYAVIARALARDHVLVEPVLYSTSPHIMLAMAIKGRGVAALPESLVADSLRNGEVKLLFKNATPYIIQRKLHVVTLKGRKLPRALAGLAFVMRQKLRDYTMEE
ncbi:MAG: LysR family transcriptional regulator [Candidatus Saccharimonadales bacterium]